MNPGELNKKITLQIKTANRNTFGEEIATWTKYKRVWAKIKALSGKEIYAAKQFHAESNYNIKIRYTDGINTMLRVLFGTRIFEILYVQNPGETNTELNLLCKELI